MINKCLLVFFCELSNKIIKSAFHYRRLVDGIRRCIQKLF